MDENTSSDLLRSEPEIGKYSGMVFALSEKASLFLAAFANLIVLATLVSALGASIFPFELANHFKLEYFLILLPAVIFRLPSVLKQHRASKLSRFARMQFALAFSCLIYNAAGILPYYLPQVEARTSSKQTKMRFLQFNLNWQNRSYDRVFNYIKALDPDLVSFEEFVPAWQKAMDERLSSYPYRCGIVREDCFGIAVYSKVPFQNGGGQIFSASEANGTPSVLVKLNFAGKNLNYLATHTLPPGTAKNMAERDKQLRGLCLLINEIKERTPDEFFVLAGDLNISPWSLQFQELLKKAALKDSQVSFGVQASWPVGLFYLRIPIDHFLLSKDLIVLKREIGPDVGSDHFPLWLEIAAPPAKTSAKSRS